MAKKESKRYQFCFTDDDVNNILEQQTNRTEYVRSAILTYEAVKENQIQEKSIEQIVEKVLEKKIDQIISKALLESYGTFTSQLINTVSNLQLTQLVVQGSSVVPTTIPTAPVVQAVNKEVEPKEPESISSYPKREVPSFDKFKSKFIKQYLKDFNGQYPKDDIVKKEYEYLKFEINYTNENEIEIDEKILKVIKDTYMFYVGRDAAYIEAKIDEALESRSRVENLDLNDEAVNDALDFLEAFDESDF